MWADPDDISAFERAITPKTKAIFVESIANPGGVITDINGTANIVDGDVEEIIYLGDHVRTRLKVADQTDFIVKIPNNTERPDLKEGMKVKIGWASEDCRALDDN